MDVCFKLKVALSVGVRADEFNYLYKTMDAGHEELTTLRSRVHCTVVLYLEKKPFAILLISKTFRPYSHILKKENLYMVHVRAISLPKIRKLTV